jgi:hypothetical protein
VKRPFIVAGVAVAVLAALSIWLADEATYPAVWNFASSVTTVTGGLFGWFVYRGSRDWRHGFAWGFGVIILLGLGSGALVMLAGIPVSEDMARWGGALLLANVAFWTLMFWLARRPEKPVALK